MSKIQSIILTQVLVESSVQTESPAANDTAAVVDAAIKSVPVILFPGNDVEAIETAGIWEPLSTWEKIFDNTGKSNELILVYDELNKKFVQQKK